MVTETDGAGVARRAESVTRSFGTSFRLACIAGGALLIAVPGAFAVSVLLAPDAVVGILPTTANDDPTLGGQNVLDQSVPFLIADAAGAILCEGNLQTSITRSDATGAFDFYYRIRDTRGVGRLNAVSAYGFAGLNLLVGYRPDGLGTVPPDVASRTGDGDVVTFSFVARPLSCAANEESHFMYVRTEAKGHRGDGMAQLLSLADAFYQITVTTARPE